ncbi:MFS transporter permease [Photobacterium jeanii]|uniref:MFS transporter permease n=1 Tax=Photobacterium jeanii TaxID=858640 RepID=A0A178K9G4_9GAMM|nr:MFS transporter [Photobacterium jeanii]OAN13757.1 MFS transporter permease [Photobacterium jeanii]PST88878.1 MFS transporter [Photobacterium jeanii]
MIEQGTPSYRKATVALALGSFLVFCNLYLFQPLLPVMASHFGVSATKVNWLLAAGTFSLALSLVPWAIASETLGRYRIMLVSLFLLPCVGLLMLAADSLLMLSLARAAMGVALAGFAAVAVAYMAEEFTSKALMLAVGTYISANSLGGIAGRLYGGLVTELWSWQVAVVGMAIFSFIGACLVYLWLPKPQHFSPVIAHDSKQEYSTSHADSSYRSVDTIPSKIGHLRAQHRAIVQHLRNPTLWLAMLVGGINFALFVNLYSVMGFRMVAPPYSLPVSITSLIFLCYLSGTVTAKLSGKWSLHFSPVTGMIVGSVISMLGLWIAAYESLMVMLAGLLLISSGAFFTHSLAYAWVSREAKTAKATATALYLVHYYVGGSVGGFYLIACWQHGGWQGVLLGGMALYGLLFWLCYRLRSYDQQASSVMTKMTP